MGKEEQRKVLSGLLERLRKAEDSYHSPETFAHLKTSSGNSSASIGYNNIFIRTMNVNAGSVRLYRISTGDSIGEIMARVDMGDWKLVDLPLDDVLTRPVICGQINGAPKGDEIHFTSYA